MSRQAASTILLVRPKHFGFNTETASSNDYQRILPVFTGSDITANAGMEFGRVLSLLESSNVETVVVEDSDYPIKPDAVFPNNWMVTLPDGKIFLFPMHSRSRSAERRPEIIAQLKEEFLVDEVIDLSYFEAQHLALEGTGSIVFDHPNKIAYACLSARTDEEVLNEFCMLSGYTPFVFSAFHSSGSAIYHTNVILSIGLNHAILCVDVVPDVQEQNDLVALLERNHKEVIFISQDQQEEHFACNGLQVLARDGSPKIIFSDRALGILTEDQKSRISSHGELLSTGLPTIESVGGGGVRCMLAEIFLQRAHH